MTRPDWMRIAWTAALFLALAGAAAAQGLTRYEVAGQAVASQFYWQVKAGVNAPQAGPGTIVFDTSGLTLPDGSAFEPWQAGVPVFIEDGADSETVVLSAANCAFGLAGGCSATAVFTKPHAGRLTISSGSDGLQEAIDFLGAAGGTVVLSPDWHGAAGAIAAATGGAQTQILDRRGGAEVWYSWDGSGYAVETSIQPGGGLETQNLEQVRYANQYPGADIGAQINAAYASCPANGCLIRIPAGNYLFSTPVVIGTAGKPVWIQGDGKGTQLTYTAAAGAAFTFNTGAPACCNFQNGLLGISRLQLNGPGGTAGFCAYNATSTAEGVHLGGSQGAQGWEADGVIINCFSADVEFDSNTWGTEIRHSMIEASPHLLATAAGVSNFGENLDFTDDVFANNWSIGDGANQAPAFKCAVFPDGASPANYFGDSFDGAQLCAAHGDVFVVGGHFENPGDNLTVPFVDNSAQPGMSLIDCEFLQDGNPALLAPSEFIANAGTLNMDGVEASSAAPLAYFVGDSGTASTRISGYLNSVNAFAQWIDHTGTGSYWIDRASGSYLGTPQFSSGAQVTGGYLQVSGNECGTAPAGLAPGSSAWGWNYDCNGGSAFFSNPGAGGTAGFDFYSQAGGVNTLLLSAFANGAVTLPGTLAVGGGPPLASTAQTGNGSLVMSNSPTLTGVPVLPAAYTVAGQTISQPAAGGTLALTSQLPSAGLTAGIGGTALSAGQCASGAAAVAGANTSEAVVVTPAVYPGSGIYWEGYVSAPGTVTVEVCAVVAATPTSSAYQVRVLP